MIDLLPIEEVDQAAELLFLLLKERTKDQSISHKKMPDYGDHVKFVENHPYEAWWFIRDIGTAGDIVGSLYLTKQREIGIAIFNSHQGKGIGRYAIEKLMKMYPGTFLANINPNNTRSIKFFESLGARHIQNTYEL